MMKKLQQSLCLAIVFLLCTTGVFADYPTEREQGQADGTTLGEFIGEIYGNNDYSGGKANSWSKAIPSNTALSSMFNLSREVSSYRTSFLSNFKTAFRYGYQRGYREANLTLLMEEIHDSGLEDGMQVGATAGEIQGRLDFSHSLKSDWTRSVLSATEITLDFQLTLQEADYRRGFVEGYTKSYGTYYLIGFRGANLEHILGEYESYATAYETINLLGGGITSTDGLVQVEFPQGAIFRDSRVGITKKQMTVLDPWLEFTPVTEIYEVEAFDQLYPNTGFSLHFTYYGPDQGIGIFERKEGYWHYLPTQLENNQLSTVIDTALYDGGTYAVMLKRNYVPLKDIASHWAYPALETFLFSGYIQGNSQQYYLPDQPIKRGEFVQLLSLFYQWPSNSQVNLSIYSDHMLLGQYQSAFTTAIAEGYLTGYQDQTLRPTMPISYHEVEWIMKRVLNNQQFQWKTIAEELHIEKNVQSQGLRNQSAYMTKAEAVYLLYSLR